MLFLWVYKKSGGLAGEGGQMDTEPAQPARVVREQVSGTVQCLSEKMLGERRVGTTSSQRRGRQRGKEGVIR